MSEQKELPPWPVFTDDECAAVERILRSGRTNYWTGDECRLFEEEFSAHHETKYGIALANGTLALELALQVLSIGPGDEVIVTPRSFFASASCIVRVGATPVFADVDEDSQNITAESIAAVLSEKTAAIVAVHLAGWPCDMPEIMRLARDHQVAVVEDCAQAHGARIDGRPVGSFGDMAAFSFCQDKIISTAGEGGMLLLNDHAFWSDAWAFKDHGKSWSRVHASDHPPGFRWLHDSFGTNWRLTEIQAAVGRLQLKKLEAWLALRKRNATYLARKLVEIDALRVPTPAATIDHSYYKFYVFVDPNRLSEGWSRDRILTALQSKGCPGLSGSCPEIYMEAAFAGSEHRCLPGAKRLGEESIMLPVHPGIETEHLDWIIRCFWQVFEEAAA